MFNVGAFEERRTSEGRLTGLRVMFIAAFVLLAVAFWLLQVVQNAKYEELAASNHLRTISLRAPRGVLFDRSGRVLVENRYSFTVAILREQTKDLDETVRRLAGMTGAAEADIRSAVERRRREPLFRPVPVIEHATFAQVAALEARRRELPEVLIQQVPTRTYPQDRMAAHLFGYVGEIQEPQLALAEFAALRQGDIIGQAGLEKSYNSRLMGTDGNRIVVVNSRGRELDELGEQDPIDGQRLQLTLDYDLQRALEDGFVAAGFNGAGVVLDPRSGEVLAMTSLPAYDPNAFAVGIGGAAWARLMADPLKPMTNRVIQGTYSPGSTFKIVMAVAGLETGVITPGHDLLLSRLRHVLWAPVQVPQGRRARQGQPAAGTGSVVQRVLLQRRRPTQDRSDSRVRGEARPDRQDRHRSAGRVREPGAVDRVEAARLQTAMVPGRDDLGGHRPGRRVGDAARACDDDRHGGQRRHARHAAPHSRGRRGRLAAAGCCSRHRLLARRCRSPEACTPYATGSGGS